MNGTQNLTEISEYYEIADYFSNIPEKYPDFIRSILAAADRQDLEIRFRDVCRTVLSVSRFQKVVGNAKNTIIKLSKLS